MAWLAAGLQLLLALWNWWTSPTRSRTADAAEINAIPDAVDEALEAARKAQEAREAK
mgnify:FL=1|jgi:hypothetical protein